MDLLRLFHHTRHDLTQATAVIFAWQLLTQLLGFVASTPLIAGLADHLVRRTGSDVISNYDITRFVLTPTGLLCIVAVTGLVLTFYFAQFAGYAWIAGQVIDGRPPTLRGTIGAVAVRLPALAGLGLHMFARVLLLTLPFLGLVVIIGVSTLQGQDVNYFLAEQPPEWRRAVWMTALVVTVLAITLLVRLARWSFAIPMVMLRQLAPHDALQVSAQMLDRRLWHLLTPVVLWIAITATMAALSLGVVSGVTAPAFRWAGVDPQRVLPLVGLGMTVTVTLSYLFATLLNAGTHFLITRQYCEEHEAPLLLVTGVFVSPRTAATESVGARLIRPLWGATLALAMLAGGVLMLLVERLDTPEAVAVTAHRGGSPRAPENTLAAFRDAYAAGADYVELDVQRTRDEAIVVFHDGDFQRMAHDARRVRDLTLAEVKAIDIGSRRGPAYVDERAPTLQELITYARGKLKLNIELKYNVPDPGLAPAVIALLREEQFLDHVVITSLDYAALRQVKAIEPRAVTGLIVTASIGDLTKTTVDFLSVNQKVVNASLVDRARAAGKSIHAWTVNSPDAMLRMIEYDVDNIITDDPVTLAGVIRTVNGLSAREQLGLRLRVLFSDSAPALPQNRSVNAP